MFTRTALNGGVEYTSDDGRITVEGVYLSPDFEADCRDWTVVVNDPPLCTESFHFRDAKEAFLFANNYLGGA
jgi:hypothetical protein